MVDLNDLELSPEFLSATDEVTDSSADGQFFAPPSPPDDGAHLVELALGKDGIKIKRQRSKQDAPGSEPTGPLYLSVHLAERGVVEEGKPGFMLFDRVTSIKMAQSGTSRLRAILAAAGVPAPTGCTLAELRAHVEAALASKPQVSVVTQWRGSVKLSDGKYFDAIKGQANFPKSSDGKPLANVWVKVTENGGDQAPTVTITSQDDPDAVEVRAQATPVRYGQPR